MNLINKNNGDNSPSQLFLDDEGKIKEVLRVAENHLFSMDIPVVQGKNISGSICGAGTTSLTISPDGTVYPCVSLKTPLGSVIESSVQDIWNGEIRASLVKSLVWENTVECKTCEVADNCPHCVGISQAENGSPFTCNHCDRMVAEAISELDSE
ncbi:SPASM domain-containing protein [Chitinivibrio alkaliphilus]|nr:SPASM domain-containing protein [Chitinivibrio alkaliphilus]